MSDFHMRNTQVSCGAVIWLRYVFWNKFVPTCVRVGADKYRWQSQDDGIVEGVLLLTSVWRQIRQEPVM